MKISGRTAVAGVIGHPVSHSLSPVIHNAGFASLGVDWAYVAFDVLPDGALQALEAMRSLGIRGLSVTMPHKSDMARLADVVSAPSARLASVNTLTLEPDGRIRGDSTDGDGLVSSLRANGIEIAGRRIVMLGAGGAARSVVDALVRHDAERIVIVNRTFPAARTAADLDPGRCDAVAADDRGAVGDVVADADLVINATSVGMNDSSEDPSRSPIDVDLLEPRHVVVDLVYHPLETALLRAAAGRGCTTANGLGMLIHQAALQQKIWTGHFPDVVAMTTAATAALSSPVQR